MNNEAAGTIFIVTRYSVFNKDMGGLRLAKESTSLDDYRARLFDPARLNSRHQVFETITAASLIGQDACPCQIHFIVFTSDILPPEHMAKLEKTLAAVEANSPIKTRICTIASGLAPEAGYASIGGAADDLISKTMEGHDAPFATVRLDDDDALAASFCADLSRFVKPEFAGFVVTFPYGLEGAFDAETATIRDVRRLYAPNVALGLAFINACKADGKYADPRVHVYRLGSHMNVHRTNPVILWAQRVSYLRIVTEHNDSRASARHGFQPLAFPDEMTGFKQLPFEPPVTSEVEEFTLTDAMPQVGKLRDNAARLKKEVRSLRVEISRFKAAARALARAVFPEDSPPPQDSKPAEG